MYCKQKLKGDFKLENYNYQQQFRRNRSLYPSVDMNRTGVMQPRPNYQHANVQSDGNRNAYRKPNTVANTAPAVPTEPTECEEKPSCSYQGVDRLPLAMAYVPWQQWKDVYPPDKALRVGTIFPELNLPLLERSCGK